MIMTEDKPGSAAPPPSFPARGKAAEDKFADPRLSDPWTGWKPEWGDTKTPHGLQERHAPTEPVTGRGQQRRIVDARLWDAMSPAQQDAAIEVALAYEMMSKGLGFIQSNWERIPGCNGPGNVGAAHGRLITAYVEWTKLCHREKVSHSMIIDILVFGRSLAQCDAERRVRKGAARHNLLDGLTLYCRMKGWRV